jgi:hypothetical protein
MTAYGLQRLDEIKAGFQQTMDRWVIVHEVNQVAFLPEALTRLT